MKRFFSLFGLALVLGASVVLAQPTSILGPGLGSGRTVYHQAGSRTLSADTVYILTGLYFVDSTFSLTIPAGTIIKGDTAATMIIQRGARVYANGTSTNPVVFTSLKPAGQRKPGDWGGVIILGNAPVNQVSPFIEGGIIPGTYGGPDPNDNSGSFRYVRIEFPGYRFQLNNEVNGLTMGGVGRGTTIEYVQVSYSFDDSFEWFGGTVDAKYLVAFGGTDDEFDTDFGYQGRVQYAFGLKDPDYWDPTGESNGFESDNEGSASINTPRTLAHFSNVTLVGPRRVDTVASRVGNKFQYSSVLRRGTQFSYYNSVILGYPGGISLRDLATYNSAIGDTLRVRNLSLAAWDGTTYPVMHGSGSVTATQCSTWFNTPSYSNLGGSAARLPNSLGLVDMNNLNNPDPRPASGSEPAIAGTEFTALNSLTGGYFTATSYRGAFDPSQPLSSQWTAGWTNFDPQNINHLGGGWNLVSVPRVPATYDAATLFPTKSGSMFGYSGSGYSAVTTLENGPGYWAYYTAPKENLIPGTSLTSTTVTATGAGWILIGSVSRPATSAAVTTNPSGLISGSFFGYNGTSYTAAPELIPGQGYWVYVTGACTISIP